MKILSFKRIEKKYLINQSQYEELLKGIRGQIEILFLNKYNIKEVIIYTITAYYRFYGLIRTF